MPYGIVFSNLSVAKRKREKERKYVVSRFTSSLIPISAIVSNIVQNYIMSPIGIERRVRKSTTKGTTTYTFTEKIDTEEAGEREETECELTSLEYEMLLLFRDRQTHTIIKTRHTFPFENHLFELDIFISPNEGLVILEIEVGYMDEEIKFPLRWVVKLEDVTGNKMYSNRTIAQI